MNRHAIEFSVWAALFAIGAFLPPVDYWSLFSAFFCGASFSAAIIAWRFEKHFDIIKRMRDYIDRTE